MKTNMKIHLKRLMAIAIGATLTACAVGPDYQRPAMELPETYPAASVESAASALPKREPWWMSFNDPLLNRVMDEALANNTDLDARAIAEKAMAIAGEICIYTNAHIALEEL